MTPGKYTKKFLKNINLLLLKDLPRKTKEWLVRIKRLRPGKMRGERAD